LCSCVYKKHEALSAPCHGREHGLFNKKHRDTEDTETKRLAHFSHLFLLFLFLGLTLILFFFQDKIISVPLGFVALLLCVRQYRIVWKIITPASLKQQSNKGEGRVCEYRFH
jgi:hypothetical protein